MGGLMQISIDFDYVDKFGCPQIAILVDSKVLYSGNVQSHIGLSTNIPDGNHRLEIVHRDKKIGDFDETHDKHVIIKTIMFDGVNLDQTEHCPLTHRGKFYPTYETSYVETCQANGIELPEFITPNHYLGHNGVWVLDFATPAYTWIIQEQRPSGINLEDTIFSTGNESLLQVKSFFDV